VKDEMKIVVTWKLATITIETDKPFQMREALGELVKDIIQSEYRSQAKGKPKKENEEK